MNNFTNLEDVNRPKTKVMILEHREDNDELQKVLQSGNFTPIVFKSKIQKHMIENFHKLRISINYTSASKTLRIPISSIYSAFTRLCETNKVEFALIVNDYVICRLKSSINSNGKTEKSPR